MVFLWSMSDSKLPQISRSLLSILADLNNAVFGMLSTHVLISVSSNPTINPLATLPRAPIRIGITVTFMFHSFFNSLARSKYLSFFSLSFNFTLWSAGTAKSTILFFLLIITWSGRQAEIRWSVCVSKSQRILCVSFSGTDSVLSIYHLFIWSKLNFLHNSQWITSTQTCLVLYSFCTSLQQSLNMWLTVSSLSPHNQQLLFCCVLSILALVWLVLMALFCAVIRRDSVSLKKFPFLVNSTFSRVRCRWLVT